MWFRELSKDSDVVVSSRVRFARNIDRYNFPNTLDKSKKENIVKLIENKVDKKKYKVLRMRDMDEITENSLKEQHLISKEFVGNKDGAIITNEDSTIVAMINEEDHLRIQSFDAGFNTRKCYEKLVSFTNMLEESIPFSKSERYGYITACPTNVGSGMRVSVMLHLPGLYKLGLLSKMLEQASSIGFSIRGIYGENSNSEGYMYQISNQKTLGISDEEILIGVEAVVSTIVEQERKARKILLKNSIELEDEVFRAYGILKNARVMSEEEAITLLSKVRLGASLDLLDKEKFKKINSLITDVHINTLKSILKEDMSEDEEDIKRAEYIRKELN